MGALVTLVGISVAVLVVVGGVVGAHPYQTGWILLSAASLNVRSSTQLLYLLVSTIDTDFRRFQHFDAIEGIY